jgi:hypothetical protein
LNEKSSIILHQFDFFFGIFTSKRRRESDKNSIGSKKHRKKNDKIMKNSSINDLFNISIFPKKLKKKKQLPDTVIDRKTDIERTLGIYTDNTDVNKSNEIPQNGWYHMFKF